MHSRLLRRLSICATICCLSITSGCMNPAMYYGNPYSQPMYAPPQMLNQSTPGQLVIPESNDGLYAPGDSTYDEDPDDDFDRSNGSDDSRFFQADPEDGVPNPRDLNNERFDTDLGGPTTFIDTAPGNKGIQRVSHVEVPVEYGFDRANYRWLRGTLHRVKNRNTWIVQYSLAASDKHGGSVVLDVSDRQLAGLRDGDAVDVHGIVSPDADDRGTAIYHVEMIRPLATRLAM